MRALAMVLLAGSAHAADVRIPADPLGDPAAFKAAITQAVGRPVWVLEAELGPEYGELLVQDRADAGIYDEYDWRAGEVVGEPQPLKVGSIDCAKARLELEKVDFAVGARVLQVARGIAEGNGYEVPARVTLGPDIFCRGFAWRFLLTAVDNDEAYLELVYAPAGVLQGARRFDGTRWKKVDPKSLAARTARPAAKAPEPKPERRAPTGANFRFYDDIRPALAELERFVGEPLRFERIGIGEKSMSVEIYKRSGGKTSFTYTVHADGEIAFFTAEEPLPFDCSKPFAAADVPLDRLAELIDAARRAIPPMQDAYVTGASIARDFGCRKIEIDVDVEDARARGRVLYDASGRLRSAEVR